MLALSESWETQNSAKFYFHCEISQKICMPLFSQPFLSWYTSTLSHSFSSVYHSIFPSNVTLMSVFMLWTHIFLHDFVIPFWQKVCLLSLFVVNPFLFPIEQCHILKICPNFRFGIHFCPSQILSHKIIVPVHWATRDCGLLSNMGQ